MRIHVVVAFASTIVLLLAPQAHATAILPFNDTFDSPDPSAWTTSIRSGGQVQYTNNRVEFVSKVAPSSAKLILNAELQDVTIQDNYSLVNLPDGSGGAAMIGFSRVGSKATLILKRTNTQKPRKKLYVLVVKSGNGQRRVLASLVTTDTQNTWKLVRSGGVVTAFVGATQIGQGNFGGTVHAFIGGVGGAKGDRVSADNFSAS